MTTEPTTAPDPVRRDQLPCIPPPEFEFRTVLAARPDGQPGCFLLPGDLGPVVVRRRVTYGDWEPVRPDQRADAPTSVGTSGAIANETGGSVGTCSGEEGFCDAHGFHRHAPSDIGTEFVRQADNPNWDAVAAFEDAVAASPAPKAPQSGDAPMRQRYAEAIDVVFERWTDGLSGQRPQDALLDAVQAVRDREMERLAEDAATARRTQWEEFRALAAELRTRAETAEAQVARVRQMATAWEYRFPDAIRTATAVDAIRIATATTPPH